MSTSLTPEQVSEQVLRENAELQAQVKYLQSQLGKKMQEKRKNLQSPRSSSKHNLGDSEEEEESNSLEDSEEDAYVRRPKRHQRPQDRSYNDFKVDIPNFEGQLDPDVFLDWLQTVERVFEFKDIPDERKVKLVALKLRKYASIWWSNLVSKRARKGKGKIRTWEKM